VQIERLEQAIKETRAVLESLRAELSAQRPSPLNPLPLASAMPAPVTSAEKVALFRSLFRGREDIYPKFWSNARTGRKGYAPACANEWVHGVCEKPRCHLTETLHAERARLFWAAARATSAALMPSSARL